MGGELVVWGVGSSGQRRDKVRPVRRQRLPGATSGLVGEPVQPRAEVGSGERAGVGARDKPGGGAVEEEQGGAIVIDHELEEGRERGSDGEGRLCQNIVQPEYL